MLELGTTEKPTRPRVADPTLFGWLGILGLIAVVLAGAVVTAHLLGRAIFHLLS